MQTNDDDVPFPRWKDGFQVDKTFMIKLNKGMGVLFTGDDALLRAFFDLDPMKRSAGYVTATSTHFVHCMTCVRVKLVHACMQRRQARRPVGAVRAVRVHLRAQGGGDRWVDN